MKRHKTSYVGVYYREGQKIGRSGTERIYYVVFKKNGKVHEEKVGRQYQDHMSAPKAARIRAARIEGKVPSRKDLREEKKAQASRWTVGRLWEGYQDHLSGKSLRADTSRYDRWIRPYFGDKEPSELLYLDVERRKRAMLKKLSPQSTKHVLQLLSRIINFGVKRGLCSPTPFRISMPRVDNLKTEDLTDMQLKAFMKALDADPDQSAANIMRLALYTGMRRGELLRLQWQDVNFERGFITIRGPKGGRDQVIPLNDAAKGVLEAQERTESPFVFPGRHGGQRADIKRAASRIKKAAGLPEDFRPLHGLRHVYASMLASSGQVDLYVLQRLLTHKSPTMTQRYAHLRDEALKRASDVAGDYFIGRKKEAV